jgi:hypothetical protein
MRGGDNLRRKRRDLRRRGRIELAESCRVEHQERDHPMGDVLVHHRIAVVEALLFSPGGQVADNSRGSGQRLRGQVVQLIVE